MLSNFTTVCFAFSVYGVGLWFAFSVEYYSCGKCGKFSKQVTDVNSLLKLRRKTDTPVWVYHGPLWEIRNPVYFCSLVLTRKQSGKGSVNSKVKNRLYNQTTNCMAGMWSPRAWGSDWFGRYVDSAWSKRWLGKRTHEQRHHSGKQPMCVCFA